MSTSQRFLDPQGLARVGNLPLVARQVVEGFLAGRHRSPYHGFSVEFLDHRAYTPGDPLRALDWKIAARTDKYYVKLFEQETNLRATIILDCSHSMDFSSGTISKREYGSFLAAALTYLLVRQNDAVGVAIFDSQVRHYLPPRAHPTQFRRVLNLLDHPPGAAETDVASVLHEIAERIRRRGLVILVSDLIDDVGRIADGLQHFRHKGHEVIVFHIMDEAELTFPFDRLTTFKDMEGTGRVAANPAALRRRYLERIQAFTDRLKTECLQRKISYRLTTTKEPYDAALAAYLDNRARLG